MDLEVKYKDKTILIKQVEKETNNDLFEDCVQTLDLKDSLIIAREKLNDTIIKDKDIFYE